MTIMLDIAIPIYTILPYCVIHVHEYLRNYGIVFTLALLVFMIVCSCAELDLLYVDTRSYIYITSKLHVPSKTESASENIIQAKSSLVHRM